MTYLEFHRHLGRAGLTIRQFAERIKMRGNSVSNYSKAGHVPAHLAIIAVLVAKLEELRIDTGDLLSKIEIDSKKPRGAGLGKFAGNRQLILFQGGDGAKHNTERLTAQVPNVSAPTRSPSQ